MFSVKRAAGVIGLPTDPEAATGDSNITQILKRLRTVFGTVFDSVNSAIQVNVVAGGAGGGIAQVQVNTAPAVWTPVGTAPGAVTLPVGDGGGSLTVDGTVTVQQAVPANLQATVRQVDSLGADATDPVNQAVRVNVVAGGAGGGLSQQQIRNAAGAWADVGNDAPSQSVPINDKGGSITVDDGAGSLTVDGTVTAAQAVPANLQATVTPAVGSTFDVSDRAARDLGKVDVASLDQYTPIDVDTGAPVVNAVPVTWRKAAAGAPEFGTAGDPVRTDPTGTTTQPVLTKDSGGGDPTDAVNHAVKIIQGDLADLDSGVGVDNHLVAGMGMAAPGGHAIPVAPDMDSGAGTDYGAMPVVLTVPGAGGKAIAGVVGVPIRIDPTGTTKQPATVADGDDAATGAVADAIVAAGAVGTISAKLRRVTQGLEDLKTTIVLAAGTALLGRVSASHETSTIYNATTALTPKYAFANVAVSQVDSAIVAAVGGKKIRVLQAIAICGATATTVTFNTKPGGAGSAISMLFANGVNGGAVLPFSPVGWFETAVGEGLTVTTGAGSTTGVQVVYVEV